MSIALLPNLITLARIGLAPVLILLLREPDYAAALIVFLVAGVSDALDGWIAKHFGYTSRLGAILDPLADKLLLVSAYVSLSVLGILPFWLVLCVVFRDLLIVGGYLVYTSVVGPVQMRPSRLSKLNTVAQIALVLLVLGERTFAIPLGALNEAMIYVVLATTIASGAHYLWIWGVMKEMDPAQAKRGAHD